MKIISNMYDLFLYNGNNSFKNEENLYETIKKRLKEEKVDRLLIFEEGDLIYNIRFSQITKYSIGFLSLTIRKISLVNKNEIFELDILNHKEITSIYIPKGILNYNEVLYLENLMQS